MSSQVTISREAEQQQVAQHTHVAAPIASSVVITQPISIQQQPVVSTMQKQRMAPQTAIIQERKRVRVELDEVQDMVDQVRASFAQKDKANKQLESEIHNLREELRECVRQTDEQAMQAGSLGASADENDRKLKAYQMRVKQLESNFQRLRDFQVNDLNKAQQQVDALVSSFSADLLLLQAALKTIECNYETAKVQTKKVTDLYTTRLKQKEEMEDSIATCTSTIQSIERDIKGKEATLYDQESRLLTLSNALSVTNEAMRQMEIKLNESKQDEEHKKGLLDSLQGKCEKHKVYWAEQLAQSRQEVSTAEVNIQTIEGELKEEAKELTNLTLQYDTLMNHCAIQQSNVDAAREKSKVLHLTIETLEKKQKELLTTKHTLSHDFDELKVSLLAKQNEVDDIEKRMYDEETAREERIKLAHQLHAEETDLMKKQFRMEADFEKHISIAEEKIKEMEKEIEVIAIEHQAATLKLQVDEQSKELLANQVEVLYKQLEQLNLEKCQQEDVIRDVTEKLHDLEKQRLDILQKQEEAVTLESELATLKETESTYDVEINQLTEKLKAEKAKLKVISGGGKKKKGAAMIVTAQDETEVEAMMKDHKEELVTRLQAEHDINIAKQMKENEKALANFEKHKEQQREKLDAEANELIEQLQKLKETAKATKETKTSAVIKPIKSTASKILPTTTTTTGGGTAVKPLGASGLKDRLLTIGKKESDTLTEDKKDAVKTTTASKTPGSVFGLKKDGSRVTSSLLKPAMKLTTKKPTVASTSASASRTAGEGGDKEKKSETSSVSADNWLFDGW